MLFSWQDWMSYSVSPFLLFAIQLIVSHLLYRRYLSHITPSMLSGSAVMALGIFGIASLPQLKATPLMLLAAAYELLIIWLYLGVVLLHAYVEGRVTCCRPVDKMAMGTWVAATVITTLMLNQAGSQLHGLLAVLGMLAVLLYLAYVIIMTHWFLRRRHQENHLLVNGVILLTTITTQAIVLLLSVFFHDHIAIWFYQAFIVLGYGFYMLGLYAIICSYRGAHKGYLLTRWPHENTMHVGALAITGFALIHSQAFPLWVVSATWWLSLIVFLIVAAFDAYHLMLSTRLKGMVRGLFVYQTSQWGRVFAFGMLYAFTLAYYQYDCPLHRFITVIVAYGPYVVTMLLLMEIILAVTFNVSQENAS